MSRAKEISSRVLLAAFLICRRNLGHTRDISPPQSEPLTTIRLSELTAASPENQLYDATPIFLSDDTLAVHLCTATRASCDLVVVIQFSKGGLRPIARESAASAGDVMFRVKDGGLLISSGQYSVTRLYSNTLNKRDELSGRTLSVSNSGNVFAVRTTDKKWAVFDLRFPIAQKVMEGSGQLEALSDEFLVVREQNTLQTIGFGGQLIGSFKVGLKSKCANQTVELASHKRLLLSACGYERLVDFNGTETIKLRTPGGMSWGLSHRWAADGNRILYDHFTEPAWKTVGKTALALGTLGAGALEEKAEGETVRVLDVTTNKICFDWKDAKHLVHEGEPHADISPSGNYVAIATNGSLSFFSLPTICAK